MALQTKFNRRERNIAKMLGVTPAGLSMLCEAETSTHVRHGGTAAVALAERGLITHGGVVLPEGRDIVRRARELGW